ncbi:cytochrome P460 family protein [Pararhizobium sp. PWRC1-1]|uniref:cytochrome P460 family protein n=1 Tax=Pararhizobium sp. PWRC1-1 TaxID=2804566 RepID=UPI003CFAE028
MRRILTFFAGTLIGGIHSAVSASGCPSAVTAKLAFTESGQAELPRGYRSWVHAYVAWEPITTSLLDEKLTPTPEFHNVNVEPYAYRTYMETGKWPEGSLIVKEFSFTSVDAKNCDGPPRICVTPGSAK